MREYEVTIIVQPKLEEKERTEQVDLVASWLTTGEEESDKPVCKSLGRTSFGVSN